MFDITELKDRGQCKYPLTDAPPHFFCGEATVDIKCSYCEEHAAICYGGQGKDWRAVYEMMKGVEKTVNYITGGGQKASPDKTPELPEILQGEKM